MVIYKVLEKFEQSNVDNATVLVYREVSSAVVIENDHEVVRMSVCRRIVVNGDAGEIEIRIDNGVIKINVKNAKKLVAESDVLKIRL